MKSAYLNQFFATFNMSDITTWSITPREYNQHNATYLYGSGHLKIITHTGRTFDYIVLKEDDTLYIRDTATINYVDSLQPVVTYECKE